jgi:hypothetical protein
MYEIFMARQALQRIKNNATNFYNAGDVIRFEDDISRIEDAINILENMKGKDNEISQYI